MRRSQPQSKPHERSARTGEPAWRQRTPGAESPHPETSLLPLQHQVGNSQVCELLHGNAPFADELLGEVQAKMMVGAAEDEYEQEADRVAHEVLRTPSAAVAEEGLRQTASGEARDGSLESGAAFEAGDRIESQLTRSKGGGNPLPSTVRAVVEPRFGVDFSAVRVHSDHGAAQLNRAMGAQAFTHGRDIYYGAGRGPTDLGLTAHELTHVIQQTGGLRTKRAHGLVGNSAVARALTHRVQRRNHRPTSGERLTALESRQTAVEKRQTALEIDAQWRARFGARLASYEEATYRITNAIDAATAGFQEAQMAQAETDALKTQVFGSIVTVAAAGLFEPLATAGLGRLGRSFPRLKLATERIPGIVERAENPVVAVVGGYMTNIRGAQQAADSARRGRVPETQTPGGARETGGALAYLTSNLETLAGFRRQMEEAFSSRADRLRALPNEQIASFDPGATQAAYQQVLDQMNAVCGGAELLKDVQEIARIYERYMWAAWLRGEIGVARSIANMRENITRAQGSQPPRAEDPNSVPNYSIGSDIESRLMAIGVGDLAGVQLTGHWYSSNTPDDWKHLLMIWANTYRESIANE